MIINKTILSFLPGNLFIKTKKSSFKIFLFFLLVVSYNYVYAQLWDNYDGVGSLTYTSEDPIYWVVNSGQYEAQTGGISTPEHSYSSYDMTNSIADWDLSDANTNEWIGWMDLNRTSVSGWGLSDYDCGMVLVADNSDFNANTTTGYAIGFRDGGFPADELVLFKFSTGIIGGITSLPGSSTEILSSGYAYSDGDNGVNFYVKLESDGKWTIKYKVGIPLSDADAIDPANYSDGSVTSLISDGTYRGATYKYAGWVYSHNTGGSEKTFFDNFGFAQDINLPVELTSFSALPVKDAIKLIWRTETEVNNYGFEIERTAPLSPPNGGKNVDWQTIGFVEGHGNSNSPKEYSFMDNRISNRQYSYRLKQIDNDGTFEYSKVININANPVLQFKLEQNFPNPFNPTTAIKFSIPVSAKVNIKVFNVLGQEVAVLLNQQLEAGDHSVNFDASGFDSGIYFYRIEAGNFVKINKMTLLK